MSIEEKKEAIEEILNNLLPTIMVGGGCGTAKTSGANTGCG